MRLTGWTMRVLTEGMGVDRDHMAQIFDVAPRTMSRWLAETKTAPDEVCSTVASWAGAFSDEVDTRLSAIDQALSQASGQAVVVLWRYPRGRFIPRGPGPRQIWQFSSQTYDALIFRIATTVMDQGYPVEIRSVSSDRPHPPFMIEQPSAQHR